MSESLHSSLVESPSRGEWSCAWEEREGDMCRGDSCMCGGWGDPRALDDADPDVVIAEAPIIIIPGIPPIIIPLPPPPPPPPVGV